MSIRISFWAGLALLLALAGCGRDEASPNQAEVQPERVAQVFVAKATRPVIVSWMHAGAAAGAVEYVVYRVPKDGSAPAVEIARRPVGSSGQRVYVLRDPEVDDATRYRYGVAVAGARQLTQTTFSDENAPIAAATSCQVQDISLSDVDGDGISNEDEFDGWQIFIAPLTASPSGVGDQLQRDKPVLKKVSSSPFYDDTDGDGLCDWQEHAQAGSDPSSKDTDGDGLGDFDEIITWNSNPNDPDSDDDAFAPVLAVSGGQQQVQYVTLASANPALLDGRETCASSALPCNFKTSPTIADTDGDSYTDYDEIIQLGAQFNPLVANLPQLELSLVGTAGLTVNVAYTDSTQQAQTKSTSLSQGQSDTGQNYGSTVRKTWNTYGQTVTTDVGAGPKGLSWNVEATASFQEGTATTKTNGWSKSATNQSQQTYNDAVQTARQQGRQISGGSISMGVQIRNTGQVSYDLTDLAVTALQRLPQENSFKAVGTLQLATPLGADGISLAPGDTTGVLQVTTTTPAGNKILDLMANPASLYFDIASFKISNSQKVDFDFIDQVTNAQTGLVLIDFGGNSVFSKRVATNVARVGGKIAGVRLGDALKTLGIAFETSTKVINGQTVTVLTGVQDPNTGQFVRVDSTNNRFWVALRTANSVSPLAQNFEDIVLEAGGATYLLFVTDADGDGVYLRDEFVYGTSDANADSDGDGLTDFAEVATGWQVPASLSPLYPIQVFSNPAVADADNDGFNDKQEMALATDPNSPDTDGDLLCDGNGSAVNAAGPCRAGTTPDPQPLVPRFAFAGASPAAYSINAPANAPIAIDFSLPLRATSTLQVRSATRGPVQGTSSFGNGGRTLTFTPQQPFMPNESIEVSVTGATSEASGALLPDYHYRFRIATPANAGLVDRGFSQITVNARAQFRVTSIISGDFNQDGALDIALTGYAENPDGSNNTANTVFVGFGGGQSQIVQTASFPLADDNAPQGIVAGDFNNDGRLDLATANRNSNSVGVLLAGGTQGQFSTPVAYQAGQAPVAIAAGDFNGDGNLDLVTANRGAPAGSGNTILLGKGDGTFTPGASPASGSSPRAVAVGDVNNDGFLDILTASGSSGSATVLTNLGRGDGTFSQAGAAQPFTAAGFPVALATGDFNGDGLLDVVTANQGSNDVSLLLGNGDGVFTPQPNVPVGSDPNAIVVADLNGDGKLDIATANAQPAATVTALYAQASGGFERQDLQNLAMSGTALVADTFQSVTSNPVLSIVVAGSGNPSGFQAQFVWSLP